MARGAQPTARRSLAQRWSGFLTGPPPSWGFFFVLLLLAGTAALVLNGRPSGALAPGMLAALLAPLWLSRGLWLVSCLGLAVTAALPAKWDHLVPDVVVPDVTAEVGGGVLLAALLVGAIVKVLNTEVQAAHSAVLRQSHDHQQASVDALAHQEALRQELAYATTHDTLTGLTDRAAFVAQLGSQLAEDQPLGVAVIGLAGFAELNDTMGPDAGDEVLVEIARRLRGGAPEGAVVARLGGDEFAVLLPGYTTESARPFGVRLRELLQAPVLVGDAPLPVRSRIGIACTVAGGLSAAEVLRRGEMTARSSSAGGPAGLWEADASLVAANRVEREADLQRGLLADEFFVLYQPLISTHTGAISSVEALVRWRHPERGVVGPDEFIDLAERCGLIVPLGIKVLERACSQLREWVGSGKGLGLTVAVNVSARQLLEADFVLRVREVLWASGVNPGQIVLELTESMLVDDSEAAITVLWQLRALGVRLAIDDFGTGYSSLARLGEMPVDELKIDKSFVDRLGAQPHDSTALITAAVAMGHGLKLEVVAEGVETAEQAYFLAAVGCDLLQGYLLGRPQEAQDVTAQLGQRLFTARPPEPRATPQAASVPGVVPSLKRP